MHRNRRFILVALFVIHSAGLTAWSAAPDELATADSIDRLLNEEIADRQLSPLADDETYLKRVYLDLIGQTPSTEEILAFGLDRDSRKRRKIVETLLGDAMYGANLARYWRDVIMYRRTDPRAALAGEPLLEYLSSAFNDNVGWDEIVTDFITATGDVRERGDTALIMAQGGKPEDIVAEVSRIFLGIQIQCAQCHDHPTDRWQREQFHELAAFFPRVAVRPKRDSDKRTFVVTVNDNKPKRRKNANNRAVGTLEHRMPDLDDPASQGTETQPVFFLNGSKLPLGTLDSTRRMSLAQWITSPENPWFAKAFVNRVWAELVGEGFCEPVDDMGPDRDSAAPGTHDRLASAFIESNFDVKWLYRTILATEMYQRASRSRREFGDVPFAANCPQRLRGDQLYDALVAALGIAERQPPKGKEKGGYGRAGGPRGAFNAAFGFDPSDPRMDVKGSIQQALAIMNGPLVTNSIRTKRGSVLAAILATHSDDRDAVMELYLQTLARSPTEREVETSLQFIRQVKAQSGNRREPFEDLLWALVNSTEFLYRK